ncbi:MAG: 23S rRNA (pseudouridine(1915)-N(3))-methyltransferase RlmH [Acutalibacteraceae bacterium]
MLTVNCICVGKLKERYWTQACEEYQKRLGAFCKFRIMEVADINCQNSHQKHKFSRH